MGTTLRSSIAGLILAVLSSQPTLGQQKVAFPSNDADLTGGAPTRLSGLLFRAPGDGPFPALIFLHACDGIYRTGRLAPQYEQWRDEFVRRGYVVLVLDSLTPRGLSNTCSRDGTERGRNPALERARDAHGALAFLQAQSFVRANRVGAIGWSQGAASLLWAIDEKAAERPAGLDFAAVVAFYPDCRIPLDREPPWGTRVPVTILGGEKDDWSPTAPCLELVKWSRLNGEPVSIIVYPDSHHGFDIPGAPATNAQARRDALQQVPAFLAHYLQR